MAEAVVEIQRRIVALRDELIIASTNAVFSRDWKKAYFLNGRLTGIENALTEIRSVLLERMEETKDGK